MRKDPKDGPEQAEIIQLYDKTSGELRRMLSHKLGNDQEAEEVAQDAYLRLYQRKGRKQIHDSRKYLFTTAMRLALNVLRRRKTEKRFLSAHKESLELGTPDVQDASACRVVSANQELAAVRDALSQLPDKTRYIFLLSRYEGLTYVEIASKLGVSGKAVEYHMKRALTKVLTATGEDK